MPARRIVRDVNEAARDVARALAKTEAFAQSRRESQEGRDRCSRTSSAFCGLAAPIAPSRPQWRLAKLVARPPPVTSIDRVA
jgi:hypothetical protein